MRLILVLMLVHGLAPGLSEIGETAVSYARTGHLAHTVADRGEPGDHGPEHGCGTTQHLCACCASQVVVPDAGAVVASLAVGSAKPGPPPELTLAADRLTS